MYLQCCVCYHNNFRDWWKWPCCLYNFNRFTCGFHFIVSSKHLWITWLHDVNDKYITLKFWNVTRKIKFFYFDFSDMYRIVFLLRSKTYRNAIWSVRHESRDANACSVITGWFIRSAIYKNIVCVRTLNIITCCSHWSLPRHKQ